MESKHTVLQLTSNLLCLKSQGTHHFKSHMMFKPKGGQEAIASQNRELLSLRIRLMQQVVSHLEEIYHLERVIQMSRYQNIKFKLRYKMKDLQELRQGSKS